MRVSAPAIVPLASWAAASRSCSASRFRLLDPVVGLGAGAAGDLLGLLFGLGDHRPALLLDLLQGGLDRVLGGGGDPELRHQGVDPADVAVDLVAVVAADRGREAHVLHRHDLAVGHSGADLGARWRALPLPPRLYAAHRSERVLAMCQRGSGPLARNRPRHPRASARCERRPGLLDLLLGLGARPEARSASSSSACTARTGKISWFFAAGGSVFWKISLTPFHRRDRAGPGVDLRLVLGLVGVVDPLVRGGRVGCADRDDPVVPPLHAALGRHDPADVRVVGLELDRVGGPADDDGGVAVARSLA